MSTALPGQRVMFTHDVPSAQAVEARRTAGHHHGNRVGQGDQHPADIVAVNPDGTVNLKVLLDGTDEHWATNVRPGDGPGTFQPLMNV